MLFRAFLNRVVKRNGRLISTNYTKSPNVRVDLLSGDDKGILVVGLDRVKGRNSLSKSLVENLEDVLESVKYDKDVRALILSSHVPGVFCAGADLKERLQMSQREVEMFVVRLGKLMSSIENTPVPVIAAIDGAALGGGLEMALACDIRIASEKAQIGLVETKLAIIPGAGGTQRLSRLIGPAKAKEMIFTSRVLSGRQAEECGIVNNCVQDPYETALQMAREILPNGPIAVKMAKLAITKGIEVDLMTGFEIEKLCYAQVIPTKDRIEGLLAFQQKRKPNYTGN